jgi:hypothetical protein
MHSICVSKKWKSSSLPCSLHPSLGQNIPSFFTGLAALGGWAVGPCCTGVACCDGVLVVAVGACVCVDGEGRVGYFLAAFPAAARAPFEAEAPIAKWNEEVRLVAFGEFV